jgi:hypothetical protein
MILHRRIILLIALIASACGLEGCSDGAASPAKRAHGAASPSTLNKPQRTTKLAPREAPFSIYNNPEYGVSFEYPRNYALEEGDPAGPGSVSKTQAELEDEQPGAILVATVVVPEDGYPNTTFQGGSLQFAINPSLMAESCKEVVADANPGVRQRTGTLMVQGVFFTWTQHSTTDAAAGTESLERDYAGYANGACYEFFVHITVGDATNRDAFEKQADMKKIARPLEKIATTLQIAAKSVASEEENMPVR